MEKVLGRLDWMPRKKTWRVLGYKGKSESVLGHYPDRLDAVSRLRYYIDVELKTPEAVK